MHRHLKLFDYTLLNRYMAKGEISWKGSFEDGRKRQAYAKKIGRNWRFFDREKRYDNWEPVLKPEFDDWMELLDGVDRRVHRRLLQPQDADRLRQKIKELFPGVDVPKPSWEILRHTALSLFEE